MSPISPLTPITICGCERSCNLYLLHPIRIITARQQENPGNLLAVGYGCGFAGGDFAGGEKSVKVIRRTLADGKALSALVA
jgi:nitrate/nitrite transporter NarK